MKRVVWKNIPGFENYYEISSECIVRSIERFIPNGKGRTGKRKMKSVKLTQNIDNYGYKTVSLCKNGVQKTYRVHFLMWISFVGKINDGFVIDHIDDNPSNNNIENLQLLSHRNNIIKGTVAKRSKHSKFPNVSYRHDRKKFFGRIQYQGKSYITGHFNNETDAYKSVIDFKKSKGITHFTIQ